MSEYGIYDVLTRTAAMPTPRVNVVEGTRPDLFMPLGANTNPAVGNSPAEYKTFPQFIMHIKVATDNIMYFDTTGAGWTKNDIQDDFYTKVLDGLPPGVTRFKDGVFYSAQDTTGRSAEYVVILTQNLELWYNEKSSVSWNFKGWRQLTRRGALAGEILRLFKISDAILAVAGRFQDANGDYYGLCAASGKNIESWTVFANSKLSKVKGAQSYAKGCAAMINGDLMMYGRLLNDEGTNVLSAQITTGPATWSQKGVIGLYGVEEMCSLVDTATGCMGMVVPFGQTSNSFLGCGKENAAAGCFAFLDPSTKQWKMYRDLIDTTANDNLASYGVVFSSLFTNFKRTTFAVLARCNAPLDANAPLYQVTFVPNGGDPPEMFITKIAVGYQPTAMDLKYGQVFHDLNGQIPIVVTGVAEPTLAEAAKEKVQPDPFALFKNKYFWLGLFVLLVLGGVVVYANMVESIGQSHVQSEALIKQYMESLKKSEENK